MEHSFEDHLNRLNKLCRVCGERSKRNATKRKQNAKSGAYLCENNKRDILLFCRINIDKDSEGIHSTTMCHKCYMYIANLKSRGVATDAPIKRMEACIHSCIDLWSGFNKYATVDECAPCSQFLNCKNFVYD